MDGRKTCKGCSAVVVKPIVCGRCGVAAHPACLSRTGHPHSDGRFVNCRDMASHNAEVNPDLIDIIRKMIRSEFEDFRKEMRELYQEDTNKVKEDIQSLAVRMDYLEDLLVSSESAGSPSINEEDIMEELEDREREEARIL